MEWLKKAEHFEWRQKGLVCWKKCARVIKENPDYQKYEEVIEACRDVCDMYQQCLKFELCHSAFFYELCNVCCNVCEHCASQLSKHEDIEMLVGTTAYACRVFAYSCMNMTNLEKLSSAEMEEKFTITTGVSSFFLCNN